MKDRKINFSIKDLTGYTETFTTLKSLTTFVGEELEFWKKASEIASANGRVTHGCLNIANNFQQAQNTLNGWEEHLESWDDSQLTSQLRQLGQQHTRSLSQNWLWSGHPYADKFVALLGSDGQSCADAFLNFVAKKTVSNIQSAEVFKGVLYGYEFLNQDSDILQRRKDEESSVTRIRDQLSKAKDTLFAEVAQEQDDFSEWTAQHKEQGEQLITDQQEAGKNQIKDQDDAYNEKLREWSASISDLETTYEEKLRLKKPAEYWEKAASRYSRQGWAWVVAIVVTVFIGLINAQDFFVHWLQGKEIGVKLSSVQGLILFGSIAATYAYILRVFSRLAFSAFHLMRDAQEREQLTYLYLSLINESAIDESSREVVLQALFSRSETGLLAQEHGPTMPLGELTKLATTKARG